MGAPKGSRNATKPGLAEAYIAKFNETGSFEEVGRAFGVTPRAVALYFQRNGIRVLKIAVARPTFELIDQPVAPAPTA